MPNIYLAYLMGIVNFLEQLGFRNLIGNYTNRI